MEIIYDYDACRVRQVFYQVLVGRTIVGFIVPDLCQDSLHYFIQRHVLNRWNIFNSFTLVVYFAKCSTSSYYGIPHLLEVINGCIVGRVVCPYPTMFVLVHPERAVCSRMRKGSLIIGIRLLKTIVGNTKSKQGIQSYGYIMEIPMFHLLSGDPCALLGGKLFEVAMWFTQTALRRGLLERCPRTAR